MFGLGAILCEILTGQPPYIGASAHEVRVQALRWQIQPAFERLERSPFSGEWVALCKKCLSLSPTERFSDAAVLGETVAQLRQAAEQRAQRAERERMAALVRESEQRRRRRQLAILGGLLLGGMALVMNVRRYTEAEHYLRCSLQICQGLAQRYPDRSTIHEDLAQTYERLGRIAGLLQRAQEALDHLQ